jgi:hypothetical protein
MSAITVEGTAKHIAALLGLTVTAKKGQPTDIKGTIASGVVVDEAGQVVCLINFDLAAAASVGAALSRVPAGAAQDAVRRNLMDEVLIGNFHEVINVLTVLTTAAVGRRTILKHTKQGKEAVDPALTAFGAAAKNKLFGQLSVQGYAGGHSAFLY